MYFVGFFTSCSSVSDGSRGQMGNRGRIVVAPDLFEARVSADMVEMIMGIQHGHGQIRQ